MGHPFKMQQPHPSRSSQPIIKDAAAGLPFELRRLVSRTVAILGDVLREDLGDDAYQSIESVRQAMSHLRHVDQQHAYAELNAWLQSMSTLTEKRQIEISRSFTLMLQLINACENAYRTYRLRQNKTETPTRKSQQITFVLTAHPTESRSPSNVAIFHELGEALGASLESSIVHEKHRIRHLLKLAWRTSIARPTKPRVRDEAEFIYSILLRHDNLEALIEINRDIAPLAIRTWVGGDKDGHSGVDEKTLLSSLRISRRAILKFVELKMREVRETAALVKDAALEKRCLTFSGRLRKMRHVRAHDGSLVTKAKEDLRRFSSNYRERIGEDHPALLELQVMTQIFPAWVVPLEVRDSSDLILKAAAGAKIAIRKMLETLADVSKGGSPDGYVGSLIISMASSFEHVQAGERLIAETLGGAKLPVVPLFEERIALERSGEIVREMLRSRKQGDTIELMLGYSDSAKEMGVLPSRMILAETVTLLDRICRDKGVMPIFFHGSGGSVDRGGGSIEEQTSWMPESALLHFKATIQGEMIDRTFSSPEILRSQMIKLASQLAQAPKSAPTATPIALHDFSARVADCYSNTVNQPQFFEMFEKATAYSYLRTLNLGSRPARRATRSKGIALSSLRAIPWVLSWTQTRVLFPTWWGVGSSWAESTREEQRSLKECFVLDPAFRSFVKLLGFTLAKVELPVWRLYLENSGLSKDRIQSIFGLFQKEFDLATEFVRALSGNNNLLWFRPWLGTSIRLRASMIHPLNVLQILNRRPGANEGLIRETATGIASGMMTTG